jgi:hypothetical protein
MKPPWQSIGGCYPDDDEFQTTRKLLCSCSGRQGDASGD